MDRTSPMTGEVAKIYKKLEVAIEQYTKESISPKKFKEIIKELNDNNFGICIDENLIVDNRVSFNEHQWVSYEADSSYEDEADSSYEDEDEESSSSESSSESSY